MKKILFILTILPTILAAQNGGFVITGNVEGLKDGEVKITSTQDNNQLIAKGTIQDGNFVVKGAVPEPGLYWLTMGGVPIAPTLFCAI